MLCQCFAYIILHVLFNRLFVLFSLIFLCSERMPTNFNFVRFLFKIVLLFPSTYYAVSSSHCRWFFAFFHICFGCFPMYDRDERDETLVLLVGRCCWRERCSWSRFGSGHSEEGLRVAPSSMSQVISIEKPWLLDSDTSSIYVSRYIHFGPFWLNFNEFSACVPLRTNLTALLWPCAARHAVQTGNYCTVFLFLATSTAPTQCA